MPALFPSKPIIAVLDTERIDGDHGRLPKSPPLHVCSLAVEYVVVGGVDVHGEGDVRPKGA